MAAPKSVLVVEDEKLAAQATTRILEEGDFTVEVVSSGEDALELMKTAPNIDLVLMDLNLGKGMDGFETAEKLRECSSVPVVFHSSQSDPSVIARARQISRYGYVYKRHAFALLVETSRLALDAWELLELLRVNDWSQQEPKFFWNNTSIIAAICDTDARYTWINNPHRDFAFTTVEGRTDLQLAENAGTEALHALKQTVLRSAQETASVIEFPSSGGTLKYSVRGAPIFTHRDEIAGVRTLSYLQA